MVHEPTVEQFNAFAQAYEPEFPGYELNTVYESVDVSGDGRLDRVEWDESAGPRNRVALAWVFQDISGDQVDDLLVFGWDGLWATVWEDDHYTEPLRLRPGWSRGDLPTIRITLEDWTADGVPEIVYDESGLGGGTGLWISWTVRTLIHCGQAGCLAVWSDTLSSDTTDYNSGGMARYSIDMRATTDSDGQPALRMVDQGFSIYCCSEWISADGSQPWINTLEVYTSTVTVWSWTGSAFELRDSQINHLPQTIESQSQLSATRRDGLEASISWAHNHAAGNANEYCQLLLDGVPTGSYFGCRHTFTSVAWRDLTGDGVDEVVITAFSAGYPYGPDDLLSDISCMHQRLIAYQVKDAEASEIANVAGCVERSDLYGVRLVDVDQDGQVDILAAPTGALSNRAYKWNGQQFVLWSDVSIRP